MGDLVNELRAVLGAADHIGKCGCCRTRLVEIPATDGDPCLEAWIGGLEIGEASDERGIVGVSRSDGECVGVEEQEGEVDVREASHIQLFRRHRLTLASIGIVGPRLVVTDGSL